MSTPPTTWKLTLAYDGGPFHGWQVQPGHPTVQGTLAAVIQHVTGEPVLPQGSGRTDAGVHALGQVASFTLPIAIPAENLLHALNRALPPAIRVLAAEPVPSTFHARHSALRKTYEYRIFERRIPARRIQTAATNSTHERICSPFLAPYVWDCRWPLQLAPMQQAAAHLIGSHDFTSFAASDPDLTTRQGATLHQSVILSEGAGLHPAPQSKDPEAAGPDSTAGPFSTNTRTIFHSTLTRTDDLLLYRVTGSGFLHHMVRNLVGTLIDVGRGALTPADIPRILAARDRSTAGPTAPPQGLYLISVEYPNP